MRHSPHTGVGLGAAAMLIFTLVSCDRTDPPTAIQPDGLSMAMLDVEGLTPMEALGKSIFFDKRLSLKQNQSCASCHDPAFGFTGPNPGINLRGAVYMGSVRNRAGNRRPPTAAYATPSPILYFDEAEGVWIGGNFWDGRATGEQLGNPAADQALGPFLNPVEQALIDEICVVVRIADGPYADLWEEVWGQDLGVIEFPEDLDKSCRSEAAIDYAMDLRSTVLEAYGRVGLAVEAYEASHEVNAFSSKFDAVMADMAEFTPQEEWGFQLFEGKAMCSACHPSDGPYALFTDFTYDNLGVPANPLNPVYEDDPGFVDLGLAGFLATVDEAAADFYGAVKVPTLRNLAKAAGNAPKSFGHNGFFKSIEQIVHFYNTRDVLPQCEPHQMPRTAGELAKVGFEPACWPAPEVAENVNTDELGDLGLTMEEEAAVVAFLKTLSDGWAGK